MKIACIGWGSLIWRPEGLKIQNHWFEDGPILPIEFTRISSNNRVTLIIDKKAKPVRTLWALMTTTSLDDAKKSLKQREGVPHIYTIHSVERNTNTKEPIQIIIKEWLNEKKLDCAIWTGLSFSKETDNKRPSVTQILEHLRNLDTNERRKAEEYVRRAPRQIDTEYRRQIKLELGWTPLL